MTFTEKANKIFNQAIADYHIKDNIDTPINNSYQEGSIENRLYLKCWIDTVQWHFEDIIRDPQIDPTEALVLKRRIDKSNQDRTDLVEQIDTYFRETYKDVKVLDDARINTESPAWAVDRLRAITPSVWLNVSRKYSLRTTYHLPSLPPPTSNSWSSPKSSSTI